VFKLFLTQSFMGMRRSVAGTGRLKPGKRRLNFASFTTKERLNFPVTNH